MIEKEYGARLNALAKKYYEKKTKKSSILSVGDTPAMTPGSLERCDNQNTILLSSEFNIFSVPLSLYGQLSLLLSNLRPQNTNILGEKYSQILRILLKF